MAVEVVMPKLGMAMDEGTVSFWNKEVGDTVEKGEPIASVSSEKIEIDVEAPASGTLLEIVIPEGESVPPGTVICYIGNEGEKIPVTAQPRAAKETVQEKTGAEKTEVSSRPAIKVGDRVKISPAARKLAREQNIDIFQVKGTGPGGRITKEDIERELIKKNTAAAKSAAPISAETLFPPIGQEKETKKVTLSGMRKVIARRMMESLQTSAQLTITMKADITELNELIEKASEMTEKKTGNKLTVTDFICRAAVLALKEHPVMNSALINDEIHYHDRIDLGIAVAVEKGLVVPVIRDAEKCSVSDLSQQVKELAEKARSGKLTHEEMQGSTFSISNLGASGVEFFTPILNPPETGILGVGMAEDTPVFSGDEIKRRTILPLSLSFDHRVVDGVPAAAFLRTIKEYLENPLMMLI